MVVQLSFKIERTHLSKRNHRRAMNQANREAMEWLFRRIIPRKFTPRAQREFPGYFRSRSARHQLRKQRRFGHNLPLVYAGILRSNVLGRSKVRATYKAASLTMRFGHTVREEQKREVEAISDRHRREMTRRVAKRYTQLSTSRRFLSRKTTRSRR